MILCRLTPRRSIKGNAGGAGVPFTILPKKRFAADLIFFRDQIGQRKIMPQTLKAA